MAETAYERFLKDPDKEEAIKVDIKDSKPLDLDQIKFKIQNELSSQTEPKKPVKWLAMPDPKNIMSLYYQLNPTKRLTDSLFMDPKLKEISPDIKQVIKEMPDAKAPGFKINNEEITQERDYTTGLDEIAKGIDSGIYDLQHSLGSLLFAGTDLAANTDFLSKFENMMEKQEPTRPETWRGELTSILTQFAVPGVTIAKITGRIPAVVKMKKAADSVKGGKLRKVSQVASRVTEGATIVGVTDFLASEPGRQSLFFEPEETKGLTGRKKAGAELRNRIKYGAEGTLVGGGFPLVGKFTQLGYKYGISPLLSNKAGIGVAQLGAKGVNATVIKPVQLLLGNRVVAPLTREVADGLQKASKFTVSKVVAPLLVSGMSGKIVRQLPPFEKWRLQSVTSPNKVNRNIKRIDNFLSWFRSYGKQPKDIEGVSEQVTLYIKSRARKIDRTYEGLENTAYNLAKQFQNDYNKATTSQPMQKYFLDQVDEFLKGQRNLNDLPQELQALSKDLAKDIKSIVNEFKKVLPKGREADELAKDLATVEINNIGKYLVRSFQTFRNPEYVPDEKILNKAVDYIANNVIKKNINLRESARNTFPKLKPEQSYIESAKMHAEDILRTGKAEGKAPLTQK